MVYPASRYGKQSDVYYGLDFTMNSRFGASGTVLGGLSTGRQVTNKCEIVAKVPELGIQPTAANVAIKAAHQPLLQPERGVADASEALGGSYELPYAHLSTIRTSRA